LGRDILTGTPTALSKDFSQHRISRRLFAEQGIVTFRAHLQNQR
jgi:hypothetical protein